MKPTCKNITTYAKKRFKDSGINNISIYLPDLNKNTFNALKANFKIVEREFMGYIHFKD